MTILAVGDSFMIQRGEVIPQCEIIAKRLNQTIDNRSISGNGNTHIIYNTINAVLERSDYSLVLIGWSTAQRWDFTTVGNKWFSIKMLDVIKENTNKKIDIEETLFKHWATDVISLSTWLRQRNMPFIMWNSLPSWKEGDTAIHQELKSIKEFYNLKYSHLEDVRSTKQWYSETDHHPNQESQNTWANALYERAVQIVS